MKEEEKNSSALLVRNRPTIFVRSKSVIYFSTLCSNVGVSLSKNLQRDAKIASLAAYLLDRMSLSSSITNYLALKFSGERKANICHMMTKEKACWKRRNHFQQALKILLFIVSPNVKLRASRKLCR